MSEVRTDQAVLMRAGRALGRIDMYGERGLTMMSTNEIEAMAIALVILGLVAIPPGTILPDSFTPIRQKEA